MMTNMMTDVAAALNQVLADSFALYIKTKNFHWHVSGPHFRDYHLLLDEQATQILASTDLIAERVRKIGGNTIRSVGHIARLSEVRDNDADHVPAKDMLGELRQDNLILVDSLKKAKAIADTAGDNASSGVIDGWTDEAEQRAWFLLESARD
ncbi:MAG: DNA starvation/stationary phase protection protein [Sphingomonadales bacterium]|jgi:starvation-inducible DNA-binding protein|nr:DNA starvation/stationary phase protection protein [Sphingomonadales bacterium]MBP7136466.1 DNA starvation/stationary phase protection protein [Sphingomonadaceae bacterium]